MDESGNLLTRINTFFGCLTKVRYVKTYQTLKDKSYHQEDISIIKKDYDTLANILYKLPPRKQDGAKNLLNDLDKRIMNYHKFGMDKE
ncbi:MAG: hypothetical protein KC535_00385 [Nanoarchaeota archaeon]|nr:hypothetical protein [Nanoarchaeota archaeon]